MAVLLTVALLAWVRAQPDSALERLDFPFWDAAQQKLLPELPPEEGITLVLVDDESLVRMGERWPLGRQSWGAFLDVVNVYQPSSVILDVWFETEAPTEEVDLAEEVLDRLEMTGLAEAPMGGAMVRWLDTVMMDKNADRRFVMSMAKSGPVVLGVACPSQDSDTLKTGSELVTPFLVPGDPASMAIQCSRPVGSIQALALGATGEAGLLARFDSDGVIRRYPFAFGTPQGPVAMLGTAAATLTFKDRSESLMKQAAEWAKHPPLLRYRRTGSFTTVRFSDVLEAPAGSEPLRKAFEGRAVLVGVSALGTEDARTTAIEADIPGMFVHANAFAALNTGDVLRTDPESQRLALWSAWLLLALLGLLNSRLSSGSMVVGVTTAALVGWTALALSRMSAGHAFAFSVLPLGVLAWSGTKLLYLYLQNQNARRQASETRKAFAHYLAPAVVEQLIENPDSLRLGGERKVITAFFSDIAGFTTISESMDPAELSELLNDALGGMTEIILDEGGTIDKYIGDAIVAMFGAPIAQPDHVDRSIRAAARCQEWLTAQQPRWTARGWPEIVNRIGLNTGPATVGNMGSAQRFDYTMLGDTVNLAARLEGANKAFGTLILIGPKTAEMATDQDNLRELDLLQVKGKTEGVRVFTHCTDADVRAQSEAALAAYRAQDWDKAVEAFTALGDDPTARIFLDRIPAMRANPPGEGWDGVYRLTTK